MLTILTALFSFLAAYAWMKSAVLNLGARNNMWMFAWMDRLTRDATKWNAIAAGFAAIAAIFQGLEFLTRAVPH